MANAKDVAEFFVQLGDGEDVTNLKVQKLVYYAQGFYLALFDSPLFDDKIEAWQYGPVVDALYHHYKINGKLPIDANPHFNPDDVFTNQEKKHIEDVFDVFGQYSAWKLRNMTHDESPWLNNEEYQKEITKKELTEYFKTRID